MLMIWAILLMSVTVLGVVEYIRASAAESVQAAYQFKALHLAESGLAVGLHPNTRRGDVVLKQKIGTDSGFDVVINYEGARIPINYATDERLREAIYNLLVHWQLNAEEASIAADSVADWIDNDDNARANGAEEEYYQNLGIFDSPRNQGFLRVDEMLLVRGMDAVDRKKPDWREYFSVYGEGQIDLRTVFKDVLLSITGSSTPRRPASLRILWRTGSTMMTTPAPTARRRNITKTSASLIHRETKASSAWMKCSSCVAWMRWTARSRTGANTSAFMAKARSTCAPSSKTCCSPSPAARRTT
jgi:hypothetical protein